MIAILKPKLDTITTAPLCLLLLRHLLAKLPALDRLAGGDYLRLRSRPAMRFDLWRGLGDFHHFSVYRHSRRY